MFASSMFVVITQNVFVYFEMGQNILDYGNFSLHLFVLWRSCTANMYRYHTVIASCLV